MNLKELGLDYIDAILIHGTPGVEQMTVEQCMEVHGELAKARDKGLVRYVGFSAHHYFDKALALISTNEFDLCMLAYGYLPRGYVGCFLLGRRNCATHAWPKRMISGWESSP
jgi:predicted aldo/keto reductase-like oxidoreductase